jgi:hypothetical protein
MLSVLGIGVTLAAVAEDGAVQQLDGVYHV